MVINCFLLFFLQSGGEESRKSRLTDGQSSGAKNNGEFIDYKALYEATKWVWKRVSFNLNLLIIYLLFPCRAENDKLKEQMVVKDEQVSASKAALERFTNAVS